MHPRELVFENQPVISPYIDGLHLPSVVQKFFGKSRWLEQLQRPGIYSQGFGERRGAGVLVNDPGVDALLGQKQGCGQA